MTWRRIAVFAVVALVATGCSRIDGWLGPPSATTVPSEAVKEFPGRAVAVCMTGDPTREDATAAASALCPQLNSPVRYWGQNWFFNDCPLLKNRRAVYVCTPQG